MKFDKNVKIFLLGVIFLVSSLAIINISKNNDKLEDLTSSNKRSEKMPEISGFWSPNFIHISNDNWSASDVEWIQNATGTWDDPHIIENVKVNGQNATCCILIENSSDYFIIRNCTVFNSSSGLYDAGIKLNNTDNGRIENNNCSNNGRDGILLWESSINNTIDGNIVCDNKGRGIKLQYYCDNNTISNNYFEHNAKVGIYVVRNSINNCIEDNKVIGSHMWGIALQLYCHHNVIEGNIIDNTTTRGIFVANDCDNNTITGNLISNNNNVGLEFSTIGCEDNLIYKNAFINNTVHALDETAPNSNYWNNTKAGNYWDNHTSPDDDNDGIVDSPYNWISGSSNSIDNFPLILSPVHIGDAIYIDDSGDSAWNWSKTSEYYTWCSGSGTYNNPYLIEGLEINGTESGSCIQIANSSVYFTIRDCTLYNSGGGSADAGIKLEDTSNGTLINNNCSNNGWNGILLYNGCKNNTVSGNIASGNNNGIFLSTFSEYNIISGNIVNNNADNGIGLSNCGDNKILENNASSNHEEGIYVGFVTHDNLISGNIVKNSLLNGIELRRSKGNIIRENVLYNNSQYGISVLDQSWYNKIIENSITNSSKHGIYILETGNNTISRNTIINSTQYGIYLDEASNNTLFGNSVKNNLLHGIYLFYACDNNNITGNKASNNSQNGIFLNHDCVNNIISENSVNENLGDGIRLWDECENNTITYNNITDNTENGLYMFVQCHGNTIYRNNASCNIENGILIRSGCRLNNITNNNANKNSKNGIILHDSCDFNTISRNIANNNSQNGFEFIFHCDKNNITENTGYFNNYDGFSLNYTCNYNLLSNNYFSYNLNCGVNLTNGVYRNRVCKNVASFNSKSGISITANLEYLYPNTIYSNILHNNSYAGIQIMNSQDISIIENELGYNYYGILLNSTDYSDIVENLLFSNHKSIVEDYDCDLNYIKDNVFAKELSLKVTAEYFTEAKFVIETLITDEDNMGIEVASLQAWWNGAQIQSENITEIGNGYYNISLTPIFINEGEPPIVLNISVAKPNYLGVNYEYEIAQYYDNDMEIEILHEAFSAENFTISFYVKNSTGDSLENVNIRAWWNGSEDLVDEYYYGFGVHYVVLEPIYVENASDYFQSIMLNMTVSHFGYNELYFETRIGVETKLKMNIIDQFFSDSVFNITFNVVDFAENFITNANIQLWWNGTDNTANITNLGSGLYRVSLNPILVSPEDDPILLNMTVSAPGYSEGYYELDLAVDPEAVDKSTEQPPDDDNDDTEDKNDDKDKDKTSEDEGEVSGGISFGWYFLPIIALAAVILYVSKKKQLNSRKKI